MFKLLINKQKIEYAIVFLLETSLAYGVEKYILDTETHR